MTIRRISAVITVIRAVRASPLAAVHARTQRTLRKRESKTKLSLRVSTYPGRNGLSQLRILRFSLLQDRDVGVGIFPEGEEIFVGGERSDAGGIGISPDEFFA